MKRYFLLAIILTAGFAGLLATDRYFRRTVDSGNQEKLEIVRADVRKGLRDSLRSRAAEVEDLRDYLMARDPAFDEVRFDRFARMASSRGVRFQALQYVDKDLIIRHTYPLEGNEVALGLDLNQRDVGPWIDMTVTENRVTVADPILTVQGTLAVIARAPLQKNGSFSGLVQGVFEVHPLMNEILAEHEEFALQVYDSKGHLFWGNPEVKVPNLQGDVQVFNHSWTMRLTWAGEPPAPSPSVLWMIWGGGGLAVLIGVFWMNRFLVNSDDLRQTVASKTAALVETNLALQKSEQLYRYLFENAREGIIATDADERVTSINPAAAKLLGFESPEAAIGFDVKRFYAHPDFREGLLRELMGRGFAENLEILAVRAGSDMRPINIFGSATAECDAEGHLIGFQAFFTDVTERRQAIEELRQSRERLSLALDGADLGLWDWNSASDSIFINERFVTTLGYEKEEIGIISRNDFLGMVHPEDRAMAGRKFIQNMRDGIAFHEEYRIRTKNGEYKWVLSRGRVVEHGPDGAALRAAGTFLDITGRRRAEQQLEYAAFYDSLTGLPNRTFFMQLLERTLNQERRYGHHFSVLFLDIDRFKNINDSMGHLIGDELLVTVAQRLKKEVREADTVARLGGDEFVVLLDGLTELPDVTRVANRILNSIMQPVKLGSMEFFPSSSIGLVVSTTGYAVAEDILRDADTAMYRAKELGRGRYEIFDESMRQSVVAILELETGLRSALSNEEFELYYQPVVDLRTSRLHHFEALVRWRHPQRGIIPPDRFISIAEDSGLIVPMGEWVLRQACRQMRDWQQIFGREEAFSVSVNVSAKQFSRSNFVETVQDILAETGHDPRLLNLEITESVMLEEPERVLAEVEKFRGLGIQLHLDDFGTGFSSLSYLHRFPVDCIKIDRSFIKSMSDPTSGGEIVRAIIAMASVMNIAVVAEGVEDESQVALLRSFGCPLAQGYYFSRPCSPTTIEQMLQRQWSELVLDPLFA